MEEIFLSGTVLDAGDHTAIVGAPIALVRSDDTRFSAVTDDLGEFRIDGLEKGVYDLSIKPRGYIPGRLFMIKLREGQDLGRFELEKA